MNPRAPRDEGRNNKDERHAANERTNDEAFSGCRRRDVGADALASKANCAARSRHSPPQLSRNRSTHRHTCLLLPSARAHHHVALERARGLASNTPFLFFLETPDFTAPLFKVRASPISKEHADVTAIGPSSRSDEAARARGSARTHARGDGRRREKGEAGKMGAASLRAPVWLAIPPPPPPRAHLWVPEKRSIVVPAPPSRARPRARREGPAR